MMDTASMRDRAITLMQEALQLLDEAGESKAALYLQWAHDIAARVPPTMEIDDDFGGDPELSRPLPFDKSLVRAIGGAFAVIGTIMARDTGTSVKELAKAMGIYAAVIGEADPDEGLLIAAWAAMLHEVADEQARNA
jgi:hypothetical protein